MNVCMRCRNTLTNNDAFLCETCDNLKWCETCNSEFSSKQDRFCDTCTEKPYTTRQLRQTTQTTQPNN